VVFKVVPNTGTETVLYSFTCGADGGNPLSTLFLSGNMLYGSTTAGGGMSGCDGYGCGVVFEVNIKTGAEKVLYSFTGGTDGETPFGGVILKSGVLYGTTQYGGSSGYGVVYKLVVKTGKETVLHTFDGSEGAYPMSSLTLNRGGKALFGTTPYGGSSNAGVVFSLTIKTSTYTVLYNFTGGSDGADPTGALALDAAGNLYGAASGGGSDGYGTIFQVVPKTGTEYVLYTFTGGTDGRYPAGSVIRSGAGNLYDTTEGAGTNQYGTVFEFGKGTLTVLHTFDGTDGQWPLSGAIMDSKGDLYGTTWMGGSSGSGCVGNGCGVVWEITPK
jgi:uncharacterized repeat protein (TIGR03803 family)